MSKKQLLDWGSVKISIPAELRFTDAKGKVKLEPSLNSSGSLKTKNKLKSIKLSTHNNNEVVLKPSSLVNNRYEWNKNEIIIPDKMGVDNFTKKGLVKKAKATTTKTGNLASNRRSKPIILKKGDNKAFEIIDIGNISEIVIGKKKNKKEEVKKEEVKKEEVKKEEVKKEEVKKEQVKPKEQVKSKKEVSIKDLVVIKKEESKEESKEETEDEKKEKKKKEINNEIKKLRIEEDKLSNILADKSIEYDLVKNKKGKKYDKVKNDLKNEIERIGKEFSNIREKIRRLENLRDRGDEKISEGMIKRNKNNYDILGINNNSSTEEIKRAFKKLAVKYHPDKNKDPEAPAKYIEIVDAYNKLMVGRGKMKKYI